MFADPTEAGDVALGPQLARASLALARRFAAGATMWCCSPAWPHHGEHVAVEFVHPVIVGKRALPAVAIADADPAATLRVLSRPGDIALFVAGADAAVSTMMLRTRTWGLHSVWIGAGPHPVDTTADDLIWLDASLDDAVLGGGFVLAYHLLWELTHVCFEHPGLLVPDDVDDEPVCITCSDEAVIGEVVSIVDDSFAAVRTAAGTSQVDIQLMSSVGPGALVLVHAGTAIERIDGEAP